MQFNKHDFLGGHSKLLNVFCDEVAKTKSMSDLISLIAADSEYVNYCRKITSATEQHRKMFVSFCLQSGYDPSEIRIKVCQVATALGVYQPSDYYGILGVAPDADGDSIKKAYRKKAHILHPDKRDGRDADSQDFIELHRAYRNLGNPDLRKIYDALRKGFGSWVKGKGDSPHPKKRDVAERIISWMCISIGSIVMIVYAVDFCFFHGEPMHPSSKKLSAVKATESEAKSLVENKDTNVSGQVDKIQTTKDKKEYAYKVVQSNRFLMSETKPSGSISMAKAKMATFWTKARKKIAGKTVASIGSLPEKKITTVVAVRKKISQNGAALIKSQQVQKNADANAPEESSQLQHEVKSTGAATISGDRESDTAHHGSVSRKTDEEKMYLVQKQRVRTFIENYTDTYERKDLAQFRKFFTSNAMEQGRSFESLLPTYQDTFDSITIMNYQIELKSVSIKKGNNKILVDGYFAAYYQLAGNKWDSRSGAIRMELLDAPEGLLVSRMDYELKK